jgi:ATP-dependent DNA helicase RecQ
MIYGLQDVVRLRQMVDDSDADEAHKRHDRQKLDALLGWCEVTDCRRRPLLAYFGDEYPEDCGNCDNCLAPPATWDGTEAARKLLSTVYRTGQRFGAAHVVDVLLGKDTDKIRQHGHDRLSVHGIGTELGGPAWRSVVRQLVVQGLLSADQRRYGALVLTERSRPLLKGEIGLQLREDRKPKASKRKRSDTATSLATADQPLFEALRQRRKEIAERLDLPPYVIFHDATLRQMAEFRPTTEADLLSINGVGEAKLARYGRDFLEVIVAA